MQFLLPLDIGYVYLVFELEKSVRALLQACSHDPLSPDGLSEYYFKMSSRRMRCKEVSWHSVLSGSGDWHMRQRISWGGWIHRLQTSIPTEARGLLFLPHVEYNRTLSAALTPHPAPLGHNGMYVLLPMEIKLSPRSPSILASASVPDLLS